MKLRGWLAVVLVLGGGVMVATRGCLTQRDPDERLGAHFTSLCDIASANIDTPKAGVTKLGRYLGANLGDMLADFGNTITTIERISDDTDHDERAEVARDRLGTPLVRCEGEWMEFADAVAHDPDASALVDETGARLGRTLEIIFGEGHTLDLRRLPAQLTHALDADLSRH